MTHGDGGRKWGGRAVGVGGRVGMAMVSSGSDEGVDQLVALITVTVVASHP